MDRIVTGASDRQAETVVLLNKLFCFTALIIRFTSTQNGS